LSFLCMYYKNINEIAPKEHSPLSQSFFLMPHFIVGQLFLSSSQLLSPHHYPFIYVILLWYNIITPGRWQSYI
jgi:hypothetical protein